MIKHHKRLWIVAFLLGWAYDFLFWKKPVGINFAIFVALCLIGGFYLLLRSGLRPAPKSLWLLIPVVGFSVITFVRQEQLTLSLAYTFSILSMGLLAVTYLGGRWMDYSLSDYIMQFFQLLGSMFSHPIDFFTQVRAEQAERGQPDNSRFLGSLLRGLLIALPIVVCFASLLASADAVFDQKLADFLDNFTFDEMVENLVRFGWILIRAYLLTGILLHAASHSKDEKLMGEDPSKAKAFLGITESAVVLGSVAALFLVFVVIQFQYFFGGNVNIGVENFTYSQYARRGFNELVTIAFFSLMLILGLSAVTRRETTQQRRVYSGLSVVIVLQVIVILVSAYQRLTLAIQWHGYSRLRLYPRIFLIWVGILLVAVVILEVRKLERYFAFAAVLASLGFSVSLALVNVDAAIVRYNISRVSRGKRLNYAHLATLSTDAIPPLVEGYLDPSLSTLTQEALGATLMCYLRSDMMSRESSENWQSFNLSLWNAHRAIDEVEVDLDKYIVTEVKRHKMVRSPSNELFQCPD